RPDPGPRIAQALTSRRRDVIGAPPDVHLLLAPFDARLILVHAGKVTIIALVQRGIALDPNRFTFKLLQDDLVGALRALQGRSKGNIRHDAAVLQCPPGSTRLFNALVGQSDIAPTREQVLEVPLALTMA